MAKARPAAKGPLHHASHHLLSTAGVAACAVLILGSFAFTAFIATPGLLSTQLAAVVTSRLVSLTNSDRSGNGLGTLTVNPELTAAAQAKANDMAAKGYFAHISPDGRTSWSWFKDAGYSFTYAGENLAVDFTDSDDVNTAWLNSPTHRANIMNGHFTEIGIATAEGEFEGHKTIFVVQMFGTPAASTAPSKVVTVTSPENASEPAIAKAEPVTAVPGAETSADVLGSSVGPAASAKPASAAAQPTEQAPQAAQQASDGHQSAATPAKASFISSLLASPHILLEGLYFALALILLVALAVRTRLEFKLHHRRHVFAVLFLMVMMGGLSVAANQLIFVPPVIGQGASQ